MMLIPESDCKCSLCEEGKFIKRLCGLLPEAERKELSDWYNALIDSGEVRAMEFEHLRCQLAEIRKTFEALNA